MQIEKGVDKIVKTIRLMILDQPGYLGRVATAVGAIGESKRFFERWRTLPDRSIATSIAGAERSVAAFATV